MRTPTVEGLKKKIALAESRISNAEDRIETWSAVLSDSKKKLAAMKNSKARRLAREQYKKQKAKLLRIAAKAGMKTPRIHDNVI